MDSASSECLSDRSEGKAEPQTGTSRKSLRGVMTRSGCGLMGFFLDAPTQLVLDTGVIFLRVLSPFYFVVSAKPVADGNLRGAGLIYS